MGNYNTSLAGPWSQSTVLASILSWASFHGGKKTQLKDGTALWFYATKSQEGMEGQEEKFLCLCTFAGLLLTLIQNEPHTYLYTNHCQGRIISHDGTVYFG